MRRSLSSIILATTSLAVAATVASGPASAAGNPGITRDMVLTAASGLRTPAINTRQATETAIRQIIGRACTADLGGAAELYQWRASVADGAGVAGVVVRASIIEPSASSSSVSRMCTFAVMTPTASSKHRLSGAYTLGVDVMGEASREFRGGLYGTVQLTTVLSLPRNRYIESTRLTASGASELATRTSVESRVKTPKTKKQLRTAKRKLKASDKKAAATYKKALKAAGRSEVKRAAAKKQYRATRARAMKIYKKNTRTFVIKHVPGENVESQEFTVKVSNYEDIY